MNKITVQTIVNVNIANVWEYWNDPESVMKWNQASADWYCPKASNDLKVGGKFVYTMASRDGKNSFDFNGMYSKVEKMKAIEYTIEGGRKVSVKFEVLEERATKIVETFEMEIENSEELQRSGWQAILDSFKKYCEAKA